MNETTHATTCCIVGGGPAGMMLGLLLARAGVAVTVLEKHADFFRDFRGDTIHASTIQLMDELGFGEAFDRVPHQVVSKLTAQVGADKFPVADFSRLRGERRHIYLMPQWDFLEFLAQRAARYSAFRLIRNAEVTDIWHEAGRVAGVTYRDTGPANARATATPTTHRLRADLTVACDGRSSVLRARAGGDPVELGAPMDVLWFRIPRALSDPDDSGVVIEGGKMLVLISRAEYWQVAFLIPKGDFDHVRAEGLASFRASITKSVPFFGDGRVEGLADWDDVKMLRVQVNRMKRWFRPGLLFIGDAAHAMSPIGGVGINLAIQDAVAAANILAVPLREKRVTQGDLARIQMRRLMATMLTQGLQQMIQHAVIKPVMGGTVPNRAPAWFKRAIRLRPVQALIARSVGFGFGPEHVRTKEVTASPSAPPASPPRQSALPAPRASTRTY